MINNNKSVLSVAIIYGFVGILIFFSGLQSGYADESPMAGNQFIQGKIDGERDAQGNGAWFFSGCLLGAVGLLLPYVVEPQVPTQAIIGKPPNYIFGYNAGFKEKTKRENFKHATYGCITSGLVNIALYVIVLSTAEFDPTY